MATTRQRKPKSAPAQAAQTSMLIEPPPALTGKPVRQGLYGNGHTGVEFLMRDIPSTKLAVTFSPYGHLDISKPGFAEDFLLERGYDVLTLKCNVNNWFQDMSADVLKSIMERLPVYEQVVTYGTNMGGYAAIYFSEAVGAQTCVAISPEISIDPAVPPSDPRWAHDAARIKFTHEPLDAILARNKTITYVIFDPHTLDKGHADLLVQASNDVVPISVPHAGHPADMALAETGLLSIAFDNLVQGIVPDLESGLRRRRTNSPSYLNAMALRCLEKGRSKTAEGLLAAAYKITDRPDIQLSYSRVLLQNSKPQQARDVLEKVWPLLQNDTHLIAYRAHLQHLTGDIESALKSFDGAIRKQPEFLPFYQGERAMFRQVIRDYENEKRLRDAALARARAELALRDGETGHLSRAMTIGIVAVPVLIVGILIAVSITFQLV